MKIMNHLDERGFGRTMTSHNGKEIEDGAPAWAYGIFFIFVFAIVTAGIWKIVEVIGLLRFVRSIFG
jgi:hypothetical protein